MNNHRYWYVALVGTNTEKACRERLQHAGYESYVASQQEERLWRNGRRSTVERVVITGIVFIHLTEEERRVVVALPYIKRFLVDRTRQNAAIFHPLAIVSDTEMERLRFMLYQTTYPVRFCEHPLHQGDTIRVLRGPMRGFEGTISRIPGSGTFVVATLGILGCAMVQLPIEDIKVIVK